MVDVPADGMLGPDLVTRIRMAPERLVSGVPGGATSDRERRISTSDAAARKCDSDPPV